MEPDLTEKVLAQDMETVLAEKTKANAKATLEEVEALEDTVKLKGMDAVAAMVAVELNEKQALVIQDDKRLFLGLNFIYNSFL